MEEQNQMKKHRFHRSYRKKWWTLVAKQLRNGEWKVALPWFAFGQSRDERCAHWINREPGILGSWRLSAAFLKGSNQAKWWILWFSSSFNMCIEIQRSVCSSGSGWVRPCHMQWRISTGKESEESHLCYVWLRLSSHRQCQKEGRVSGGGLCKLIHGVPPALSHLFKLT